MTGDAVGQILILLALLGLIIYLASIVREQARQAERRAGRISDLDAVVSKHTNALIDAAQEKIVAKALAKPQQLRVSDFWTSMRRAEEREAIMAAAKAEEAASRTAQEQVIIELPHGEPLQPGDYIVLWDRNEMAMSDLVGFMDQHQEPLHAAGIHLRWFGVHNLAAVKFVQVAAPSTATPAPQNTDDHEF